MKRRQFITLLVGGATLVVSPFAARAQQPQRMRRIGVLETQSSKLNAPNIDALRRGLRELGYVEGKDLVLEYRSADGQGERFPKLATELVDLRVDVIVTRGTPAVLAAKNATSTIPIVMAAVGDPLMVVTSLAHPGGNITGLSGYTNELEAKRIEILHDLLPHAVNFAGLYDMGNPVAPGQWEEFQTAARKLNLQAQLLDVRERADIIRALDSAQSGRVEALAVGNDALTQADRSAIADLAAKNRIPTIYVSREFVEAGGLIAYGPSYPDLYLRAAGYVHKVLNGANPGELPIEQPAKFELLINVKAAKAIGLTIPPSLLARADEVIE
jgi:putative tryptophan/tyrosine transport system substrate-binding protein